ncbi:MAG: N-acetyl-gamma-glutamyl-phosphate reductase [Spirochaetes bacterium]|nr:N-acetyl-gamma-glutamyl-phosphate reductase [Spirochaetota bacterium]
MKKALIVGATGFGGIGLIDIISRHPGLEIAGLVALDHGKKISDLYPHLKGICDLPVCSPDEMQIDNIDIAFFSTPDRAGMQLIKKFTDKGIPVIDFSGDFRFNSLKDYELYAANKSMDINHCEPSLLPEAVYGLPEKFSEEIKKAKIVGNPGCFAITMLLALLPAIEKNLIASETIFCDGKTGVSGAGVNPGRANSYPLRYENTNTYREGTHQHLVEVENILNRFSSENKKILFVPQIVPMNRGILVTMYGDLKEKLTTDEIIEIYTLYYKNSPFVAISKNSISTADVRGTNRCIIRPAIDKRTGKFFICAAIDNLMKGQSGNAVQNANIILGFEETTGLMLNPMFP